MAKPTIPASLAKQWGVTKLPAPLFTERTAVVTLAPDLIRIDTNDHYTCDEATRLIANITRAIEEARRLGTKAHAGPSGPAPLLLKR